MMTFVVAWYYAFAQPNIHGYVGRVVVEVDHYAGPWGAAIQGSVGQVEIEKFGVDGAGYALQGYVRTPPPMDENVIVRFPFGETVDTGLTLVVMSPDSAASPSSLMKSSPLDEEAPKNGPSQDEEPKNGPSQDDEPTK